MVAEAAPDKALQPCAILVVCASYPPVLGGTEIEAQRVCAALLRQGHQVEVLCIGGHPMPHGRRWVDPEGVPVRLFGSGWPAAWRGYAYAVGVAWTLLRERNRYDIAYFLMGGIQLAAALPVARAIGKRILMKFSGSNTITPLTASRLGRLELRMLRRWAERVLVLNSGMVEEAVSAGFEHSQLGWMPNPVDVQRFRPVEARQRAELRGALGVPANAPLVVYVGRLAPEKQLPSLLEALAIVLRGRPLTRLALVGDGPMRSELQGSVVRLGITGSVHFAGAVPSDAVCGWLQTADVFALVSSVEGFPCSLAEAMAVGLPAVVSDIPGNTQLVRNGVHGLVVRCEDPPAIAHALSRLLDDPAQRGAFGAAGRNSILENYSTAKVTDRYERLFLDVLQ